MVGGDVVFVLGVEQFQVGLGDVIVGFDVWCYGDDGFVWVIVWGVFCCDSVEGI